VRACLCGCAALALAAAPAGARASIAPRQALAPVAVSVDAGEQQAPVPRNFLGLSFEVAALPQLAGYADRGDLVALLRSLGTGVLRFGGVTADHEVGWSGPGHPPPEWARSTLEASDLEQLGALTAASGWRVLLTLGLGHYEPQAAAQEAAAAQASLGSSLEALEIGNEPNAYATHQLRSPPWGFAQYEEQVDGYRSAIEALAPGIPLAGPDTSGSPAYQSWGLAEAIDERPALLTAHHYPLVCEESPPPSIERLLSPQTRELEEGALERYLFIANASAIPFRLDETGSVSCGGVAGVSNTFASALWALALVTRAMSIGLAGVNFHGSPDNCGGYSPLCAPTPEAQASGQLQAQPDWYALLLARGLVGERPLHVEVRPAGAANAVVSAFLAADGTLQLVAVDEDPPGSRPQALRLHLGARFHGASVLRLTAPSPAAVSGVLLGGRSVQADGQWTQPARLPHARNRGGYVTVELQPSSAALLTVAPLAAG